MLSSSATTKLTERLEILTRQLELLERGDNPDSFGISARVLDPRDPDKWDCAVEYRSHTAHEQEANLPERYIPPPLEHTDNPPADDPWARVGL